MTLAFTVFGVAQSKGNMRAIHLKGMKFPIVTDSNRKAKSWAQLVAEGASRALLDLPPDARVMLNAAVRITVAFYLPRPKKYQKRGLAVAHLKAPDIDKLLRAIFDALSSVVYLDDSQVVEVLASKHYAAIDDAPHVDIRVEPTAGVRPLVVPAAPLPLFAS